MSAADLTNIYGTIFVVLFLSSALWGATCTQSFSYFMSYPKDRTVLKYMVAWLWLMDTTHQALFVAATYGVFVSHYGDVAYLAFVPKDAITGILFTVLVSSTAQLYFSYRIWLFSGKRRIFPIVAVPMVVGQFVLQIIYMAAILGDNTPSGLHRQMTICIIYNVMAAVTDVVLAGCTSYLLQAEYNGFDSSDQLVGRLILFSFNTGLWTALVALATVVTLVAVPVSNLVYPGVYSLLCPLYCNTVLANLNSRNFLRERATNQPLSHGGNMNMPMETFSRSSATQGSQKKLITIQVDRSKATDNDSLKESHDRTIRLKTDISFA